MPHTDESGELKPLVEPRVIQALEERPRLIDMGVREEMWSQLEANIRERRTANTVASRISHSLMNTVQGSAEPVVRDRLNKNLNRVNDSILNEA